MWRKPENSIRIGAPSLVLLEDSDDRIHAFRKSWKKNLRSMPFHDPLLLDRTGEEDVDADAEEAAVVGGSPQKNANTILTTNFVSIVANLDISLSIVPNCPITNLVPVSEHKAADPLSNKSNPFQKKGWRNCHLKMKAKLILLPLINSNHWSNSIWTKTHLFLELSRSIA